MKLRNTTIIIGIGIAVTFAAIALVAEDNKVVSATHQENVSIVIDGVTFPYGKDIEIVGIYSSDDSFNSHSNALAVIQGIRINGRGNQDNFNFHLTAGTEDMATKLKFHSLKDKKYYKVSGRLLGARLFGQHPICNVEVKSIEEVPDTPLKLEDFADRTAAFEGTAAAGGKIMLQGEAAQLAGLDSWPKGLEGKNVSVSGTVHREPQGWQFLQPAWRLTELADMVGKDVSLKGTLWSMNDNWWFGYRDDKLYLISANGPVLEFPGDDHGRKATVTGRLVRQLRPSLDQITMKTDRDLVQTYVIRVAKVEYLDAEISWYKRFGTVYDKNPVSDGVPELIAKKGFRRNLMGNETTERLYAERNWNEINEIVANANPAVCDIVVKRMNDSTLNDSLRLLYATVLARVNDERGQIFLKDAVTSPFGKAKIEGVYYCLGVFPYLAPDVEKVTTNCAWAEQTLLAIMADPEKAKQALRVSSIQSVLLKIGSPSTGKALLEYALKNSDEHHSRFFSGPSITELLCMPVAHLSATDLLKLEAVNKDNSIRRSILQALLRLKDPAVAERFMKDMEDGFAYMDVRDLSSPEVLAAMKPKLEQLSGNAKSHVRMLLVLGDKDPVPEVVALLDDPTFPDKNLAMFELKRLGDSRAVAPVTKILREAPKGYFGDNAASAIESALETIANANTRDAVRELIALLSVDLGRFGDYIDRAGWQRVTAAHLIEMTGESFGIDQAGWQSWEKSQPDERFRVKEEDHDSGTFRIGPDNRIDMNMVR